MFIELVLLLISLIVYYLYDNIWRHGGKLPPGPWGVPIFGYLPFLGKIPCKTIGDLSKKYGSMVTLKLGQHRVVVVNEYEAMKEIFKLDVLTGRVELELFAPRGKYGIALLEGKEWLELRRFTMKCLRDLGFGRKSMESSIMEEVNKTKLFLRQNEGKPLYFKRLIEIAVVNAIWEMMTGEKYDIGDPVKQKVLDIISDGISDQNIVGIGAFLPWLAKMLPEFSGYTKGLEYLGAPEELARNILKKHIAAYSPDAENDFIDAAIKRIYTTTDTNSIFYGEAGFRNLHYTLIDMFWTGSDTVSSALGWGFLYLATWPEVQRKVQAEIDEIIGPSRSPSLSDRAEMHYTEATISEILRKSSFVPLGVMHSAIETFNYGGFTFPKRTVFMGNIYHVHHDEKYWDDPMGFKPERFITDDGKFRKDDHVIPFFVGRRTCPGEALAAQEIFLFLTGILQGFDVSLNPADPYPDLRPRAGFILKPPSHKLFVKERRGNLQHLQS